MWKKVFQKSPKSSTPTPTPITTPVSRSGYASPSATPAPQIKNNKPAPLPYCWEAKRNASYLPRDATGLLVTAKPQDERMTVLANAPFPVAFNNYISYFEITLVDLPQRSIVAIGLAESTFPTSKRQPGWIEKSYGYHSDDGGLFKGESNAASIYGPVWKTGDVIGCGINHKRDIYFTYNGVSLGVACEAVPDQEFYPILGFKGPSVVSTNFGLSPFVFNVTQEPAQILPPLRERYQPDQKVHISEIPPEILMCIFGYVNDVKETVQVAAVSKGWEKLAKENTIWQPLFLQQWPNQKADLKIKSWYQFYRSRMVHLKKYGPDSHPIENCEFQFKCPLSWELLPTSPAQDQRFCDSCSKTVHYVSTQEELNDAARKGLCVAFGAPLMLEPTEPMWMGEIHC